MTEQEKQIRAEIARLDALPYTEPNQRLLDRALEQGAAKVQLRGRDERFFAVIDAEDAGKVFKTGNWVWYCDTMSNGNLYARRWTDRDNREMLHRFIAALYGKTGDVSFINGETLDCRKQNLSIDGMPLLQMDLFSASTSRP